MEHRDHVDLIRDAVTGAHGLWADLGSGTGAFTLALADVLKPDIKIYSIDTDAKSLHEQEESFQELFPTVPVEYITADFTETIDTPPLDGIIMANALHYVKKKAPFLASLKTHLKPDGRFVLIEYNVDKGNYWVPYPLSYKTFEKLAAEAGYKNTRFVSSVPSSFLEEMYSAVCFA